MKARVLKPLNATRSVVEMVPVGTEIDINLESATGDGTIQFTCNGDWWESTLDDLKTSTDFAPAKSVEIKKPER